MAKYIGVNREIADWEWHRDSFTMNLLIHLLAISCDEPKMCKGVRLEVGQVMTTIHNLSTLTGLSVQQVRTCMLKLQKCGLMTSKATNKFTVITLAPSALYAIVKRKATSGVINGRQTKANNAGVKKEDIPEGFERFWEQYPRKVARQDAINAWEQLQPDEMTQGAMLHDVAMRNASGEWEEETYIPYPAKYLLGKRWMDAPAKRKNANGYANPYWNMYLKATAKENAGKGNDESAGGNTGDVPLLFQREERRSDAEPVDADFL